MPDAVSAASASASTSASSFSPPSHHYLGLLTRTLFPSPEVRFTFPLRIRHWDKQDVALVGDSSVHIKEVMHGGRLRHVASKTDFPAPIRTAQVIGNTNADGLREPPTDKEHQRFAHMLLLSLEDQTLVFVTMEPSPTGADHIFATSVLPLPQTASPATHPDHRLAVDPYSRAFAAGAASTTIYVVEMAPRERWGRAGLSAVHRSQLIDTGMKIVKMDFLFRPSADSNQILLLVVGYQKSPADRTPRLSIRLYGWDHLHDSEGRMRPQLIVQDCPRELIKEHSVPQILIPLRKFPGAFLLACERSICAYFDAHTGHITCGSPERNDAIYSTERGLQSCLPSISVPLWRSWAGPVRNDIWYSRVGHNGNDLKERPLPFENLYLAREDGMVFYIDVAPNRTVSHVNAGHLNGVVDFAFNHNGSKTGDPDGLVYGGSMCDGGVFTIGQSAYHEARSRAEVMAFVQTDTLYNWAPFIDLISHGTANTESQIVSTSGKAPHGALSHLRFGCEAAIEKIVDLDLQSDGGRDVVTKLWPLKTLEGDSAVLLSLPGYPGYSVLLSGLNGLSTSVSTITLPKETLAALHMHVNATDALLRVTRSGISTEAFKLSEEKTSKLADLKIPGIIVAATDSRTKSVLVATMDNVSVFRADPSTMSIENLSHPAPLDSEPICAVFFPWTPAVCAGVAFMDSTVRLYSIDAHGGVAELYRMSTDDVCRSLAIVPHLNDPTAVHLFSGSREGFLCTSTLRSSNRNVSCKNETRTRIGDSQVDVSSFYGEAAAVILLCDSHPIHVSLSPTMNPIINRIYFMDHGMRSYTARPISAIGHLVDPATGFSHVITCDDHFVCHSVLDAAPKALPRRLDLPGQPNRVIYSAESDVYFAASAVCKIASGKRYMLSTVFAVVASAGDYPEPQPLYQCDPGEQITSMTEWVYQKETRRKSNGSTTRLVGHLVLTTTIRDTTGLEAGRVLFLAVSRRDRRYSVDLRRTYEERNRVNSICRFENDSLLYCTGNKIKMCQIAATGHEHGAHDRRQTVAELTGEDSGQIITACAPYAYVSCKNGSFKTFAYDAERQRLMLVSGDDTARHGLAHVVVPTSAEPDGRHLAIFSDKERHVAGQFVPPANARQMFMAPSFLVKLPVSLTRLTRANIRPPWKREAGSARVQQAISRTVVARDIFGTATNGSFWGLAVLQEPAWRLLGFVQALCQRKPSICPNIHGTGAAAGCNRHTMPDPRHQEERNVDGDTLARLTDRPDAAVILKDMVTAQPDPALLRDHLDFTSAAQRVDEFVRLASAALPASGAPLSNGMPMSPLNVADLSLSEYSGMGNALQRSIEGTVELIRALVEIPF